MDAKSTKQYLRQLSKKQLIKLFDECELDYGEKWILIYAFIEKRMVENICMRLSIGHTNYHTTLNKALIKVENKIKELDKIRSF